MKVRSIPKAGLCALIVFGGSNVATAGGGSEPGKSSYKSQAASVSMSGSDSLTIGSWLLTFLGKLDPIGPTTDALEIGETFAKGAEGFAAALPNIEPALSLALAVVVGEGQPVRTETELKHIKRTVLEQTRQLNFDAFGLYRIQTNNLVEKRIEERGLKAW